MKYTGTAIPAARNAATPHAVACWLPCLDACANTPAEIAAARATAIRNVTGSAVATMDTIRTIGAHLAPLLVLGWARDPALTDRAAAPAARGVRPPARARRAARGALRRRGRARRRERSGLA